MEYTNKNKMYIFLRITIYTIGFLSLIAMSNFWMGTKENWDETIKNELIQALITRTVFLIVAGLFFLGLSFLISRIYKKKYNFSKDLLLLMIFSLVLNALVMLVS